MKNLLKILALILMLSFFSSCNLSRTAVVKDTVKDVATTTADYYSFYLPEFGRGKLKDVDRTVAQNIDHPDMIIRMVPGEKHDEGYYIIKPANLSAPSTTMSPSGPTLGEITIPLGQLKPILIPKRGN